jgi:hypothetical protein
MSLGVAIKGPEGVVLAADSRVTLTAVPKDAAGNKTGDPLSVNFDNATKLLSFREPHNFTAAVTYGQAAIGLRTAHSFVPELEVTLPNKRILVKEFATRVSEFFAIQWKAAKMDPDPQMTFLIGGFDEGEPYGRIYEIGIPNAPDPKEWQAQNDFGITYGGQNELAQRVVNGYDPQLLNLAEASLGLTKPQIAQLETELGKLTLRIPYQFLPLQDCVNLAIFLIRTTIGAQEVSVTLRGVGGPIDVATITNQKGVKLIQRKEIVGEIFN